MLPRLIVKCHTMAAGVVLCACLIWPTAALATAGPDAGTVASAHHAKDATLRVVVRSLPGRLSAKIILTGPHHVHKRVSRSVTLKLPAGAYSLSAAPVKSSSGSYYATTPRSRVVLRAGKATRSTVVYATLVPKSTVVVSAGATASLTGDPSGPRVLTITGSAARAVRVGDSLSSGVTSAAPYGYLVKVTKVAHKRGSSATLDVENTTLLAALPTGEINAEQALEPTAEAASAADLRRVNLALGRGLGGLRGAHARAAGFTINTDDLECESSAGVHLAKPTLTFTPSMAVHAHWGFLKLDSASISVTAAESLSFGATADAGAHCSTSSPGIGLFPHPITLGTFDIQVGPVPVTVTPKLQLYLSGQATIEAKATFSLEQGASVTVGASYEHGSFHPISSLSQHFTPAFTAEGDASGELALTPTVDTLIYDVAGPSFDVGAVAKLNANVKSTPWWTLQGCLQAGLGFVISPLGLNWSDPHLIQLCKTLLSATSGPPAGAGSTPPGGGSVSVTNPGNKTGIVGTPVSLQIRASDTDGGALSYAATGLPVGLSINPTSGLITGIPTTAGSSSVAVTVTDATGPSGSTTFAFAINPGGGGGKNDAIAITAGSATCALIYGGSVNCWGPNWFGELGDGTASRGGNDACEENECSTTPVPVSGVDDATQVSAGGSSTCAVQSNGTVECWGEDNSGQLGVGEFLGPDEGCDRLVYSCSPTPVQVGGVTAATQVGVGSDDACALLSTGGVECWGANESAQLGNGEYDGPEECGHENYCSTRPVAVSGITDATEISAGAVRTCALLASGHVACWGWYEGTTDGGNCHESGTVCNTTPVDVNGIDDATQISVGENDACALLSTGSVECWGENWYGQLGDGSDAGPDSCNFADSCSTDPVAVSDITDATQITVGFEDACAVFSHGSVSCWGLNLDGELGFGSSDNCHDVSCSTVPGRVSGVSDATASSTGGTDTCALISGGSIYCWGYNLYGELGDGTTEGSDVPVPVSGIG